MGRFAAKLWELWPRSRKAKAAAADAAVLEEVVIEERAQPAHPAPFVQESVFEAIENDHTREELAHPEPWNTVH